MTASELILRALRQLVDADTGLPPGERAFLSGSGFTRTDLQRAGFRNYGALCEAAGLTRNRMQEAYTEDQLFASLADLTRQLGRFPTSDDLKLQRHQDKSFPSYAAYGRLRRERVLDETLLDWCAANSTYGDVAALLRERIGNRGREKQGKAPRQKLVVGYVYLMRYGAQGRSFKIGHSGDPARRRSQIDMMSPSDVRIIHRIGTDDPVGIEEYWHKRFQEKLIPGKREIFRLSPDDVAAFKRRDYQ